MTFILMFCWNHFLWYKLPETAKQKEHRMGMIQ